MSEKLTENLEDIVGNGHYPSADSAGGGVTTTVIKE